MSDIAIRVENLGKCYRIGAHQKQVKDWRGLLRNLIVSPFEYLYGTLRGPTEEETLWALEDVSFEVKYGEVVGIIGRNGAGKSTLLKILSRITEPTKGRARVYGRVGSLLEVGTGFHPELTGRENVYMNGAILGMDRAEIKRKFDEIVDFAGVEKFIDTPVKRYSSGMKVRLGFAVAAHLEPEILLVDEVLAVGDAEFQKKCLGKMGDVSKEGRTILFVSHNMQVITRLCPRSILLDESRVVRDGNSHQVTSVYLQSGLGPTAKREWNNLPEAPGNEFVQLRSVRVVNSNSQIVEVQDIREPVGIEIVFDILKKEYPLIPHIALYNDQGILVFNAIDTHPMWHNPQEIGRYKSTAYIPGNLLSEGAMTISVFIITLSSGSTVRHVDEAEVVAFRVVDPGEGDSARGSFVGGWAGACRPLLNWTVEYSEDDIYVGEDKA